MISITADVQTEPGALQRVNIHAGPPEHPTYLGNLVVPPPVAAELVARLRAPERDISEHITPDIASAVLYHHGDLIGRRPDEWTRQLVALIATAPPADRLLLARVYPGYVAAVVLVTGTDGMVQILHKMASGALPPLPGQRDEGPDAPPAAFADALATATLADAADGA